MSSSTFCLVFMIYGSYPFYLIELISLYCSLFICLSRCISHHVPIWYICPNDTDLHGIIVTVEGQFRFVRLLRSQWARRDHFGALANFVGEAAVRGHGLRGFATRVAFLEQSGDKKNLKTETAINIISEHDNSLFLIACLL